MFLVSDAPVGLQSIQYVVENGACADTAYWSVDVRPVLEGDFDSMDPICQGTEVDLNFIFDADIPDAYANEADGQWSSADCPSCILNAFSWLFTAQNAGEINVVYNFDHPCSQSIEGSVVIAPPVDASVVPLPDLCESSSLETLESV